MSGIQKPLGSQDEDPEPHTDEWEENHKERPLLSQSAQKLKTRTNQHTFSAKKLRGR